jgi:15-cis-phytoene synthase
MDLATSYEVCRRINAAHGRTYYLATRLLPADSRRHVHALYAFARYADDLVDHLALDWIPRRRREASRAGRRPSWPTWPTGRSDDPVCKAVIATIASMGIDHDDIRAFLDSMAMDLTVTRYETYDDLHDYMHGSAAVIGSMVLPVLSRPRRTPAGRPWTWASPSS